MNPALLNWPLRAALLGLCVLVAPGASFGPSAGATLAALGILSAPTVAHRTLARALLGSLAAPAAMAPVGFLACFAISAPLLLAADLFASGVAFSGSGSALACASLFSLLCALLPARVAELPARRLARI